MALTDESYKENGKVSTEIPKYEESLTYSFAIFT